MDVDCENGAGLCCFDGCYNRCVSKCRIEASETCDDYEVDECNDVPSQDCSDVQTPIKVPMMTTTCSKYVTPLFSISKLFAISKLNGFLSHDYFIVFEVFMCHFVFLDKRVKGFFSLIKNLLFLGWSLRACPWLALFVQGKSSTIASPQTTRSAPKRATRTALHLSPTSTKY